MREKNHLLLQSLSSFNIKKKCLQSCIGADSYQYVGTHLQKATTSSHSLGTVGSELQPPSSCTSQYVYYYIGASLQKTPLFHQGPYFMNFQTRYSWNTTPQTEGHVSFNFHTGPINNIETHKIIIAIQPSNTSASTNH